MPLIQKSHFQRSCFWCPLKVSVSAFPRTGRRDQLLLNITIALIPQALIIRFHFGLYHSHLMIFSDGLLATLNFFLVSQDCTSMSWLVFCLLQYLSIFSYKKNKRVLNIATIN